jgi:hypothetical protein
LFTDRSTHRRRDLQRGRVVERRVGDDDDRPVARAGLELARLESGIGSDRLDLDERRSGLK